MTQSAENDAQVVHTWRDVAARRPEIVQAYVQERGPLPDGPVTEEAWREFWTWMQTRVIPPDIPASPDIKERPARMLSNEAFRD